MFNSSVQIKGAQTKCLAQAKQIGLALKLYALPITSGNYPAERRPRDLMQLLLRRTPNQAFSHACSPPT